MTFFIFWVFFWGLQHKHSFKNGHFWKKTMYYLLPLLTFFFDHFFVDLLDAKGHFLCFLKKVSFMGGDKKKVFFSTFFFFFKKSKNLQFSPHEIYFLLVFWTKKNDTFNDIRAKEILKMRNGKIWKIVKSSNLGFILKFPKNIFLVTFFQKKWMTNFWVNFWLFSRC